MSAIGMCVPCGYQLDATSPEAFKELNDLSLASTRAPTEKDDLDSLFGYIGKADIPETQFELGHPDGSTGGFYGVMRELRSLRAKVSHILLNNIDGGIGSQACQPSLVSLESALQVKLAYLQSIPRPCGWQDGDDDNVHTLVADSITQVNVRLEYEKNELIRDVEFIQSGELAVMQTLQKVHDSKTSADIQWMESALPTWTESIDRAVSAMRAAAMPSGEVHAHRFRNFITDRDGTINNYCDRYASSVQAAYNAVCIAKFSTYCADHTTLITAAPLGGRPGIGGLMELCTMPAGLVLYAGSKGREYFDQASERVLELEPLPDKVSELLQELYRRLTMLCSEPRNSKFLCLGSGLQYKFGEVTIARNDPAGNVLVEESVRFRTEVQHLVNEIDPMGVELSMQDTGTDIEIFPQSADGSPSFTKGSGVIGLDQKLSLGVAEGPNLVCGDTSSDVAMIEATLQLMGGARPASNLAVLFVVTSEQHQRTPKLADRVLRICEAAGAQCAILPSPDVLIGALVQYTQEFIHARLDKESEVPCAWLIR